MEDQNNEDSISMQEDREEDYINYDGSDQEISDEEGSEAISYKIPANWLVKKNKVDDFASEFHENPILALERVKIEEEEEKYFLKKDFRYALISKRSSKASMYGCFLPNSISYTYQGLGSRIYNCKFNEKGDIFLATTQNATAIFDFSDYEIPSLKKVISCYNVSWAITDSDITGDDRYMVHSTLSSKVDIFDIQNSKYSGSFNVKGPHDNDSFFWGFRVYSIKITADGKEIIAGTGKTTYQHAKIQVFDIEKNCLKKSISAHYDDINSVCFVEKKNPNLILSGSDDGTCKLWDARALADDKPVGIFYGHFCGITHVESREDNQYFLSNSKDQSLKLWDLRYSTSEKISKNDHYFFLFDYRSTYLAKGNILEFKEKQLTNKYDKSILTFWGHETYITLIRAHFSPRYTTDQRFIYTGSANGKVFVYDILEGTHVATLEIPPNPDLRCIRDLTWHPFTQQIVTTDFSGDLHLWKYKDIPTTMTN